MAEVVASKLKLLHLARIFEKETDDNHGLTGPQLISKLAELGIQVERKTLYRDIECLRTFGYDIVKYERRPVQYGLASRNFQEQELTLLADAVQSSRFLTKKQSDRLVDSISNLGSKYTADGLKKNLHVEGRVKSKTKSEFIRIDAIQQAIDADKKIEFKYYKYNEKMELVAQRDGAVYVKTPVEMTYFNDQYYLVAWDDDEEIFKTYRLDRMNHIQVSKEDATHNAEIANLDISDFTRSNMFQGEKVRATLLVTANGMNLVVDKYGDNNLVVIDAEEGHSRVTLDVVKARTFYGWLTTAGSDITIEKPLSLRQGYLSHLQEVVKPYLAQMLD